MSRFEVGVFYIFRRSILIVRWLAAKRILPQAIWSFRKKCRMSKSGPKQHSGPCCFTIAPFALIYARIFNFNRKPRCAGFNNSRADSNG